MITHEKTVSLPYKFTVTFSMTEGDEVLQCMWDPHAPSGMPRRHWRKLHKAYEIERNAFMLDVATMLGGGVVIADMEGKVTFIEPETRQ